jgi:vancomycin resistance protein VanJ
MPYLSFLGLMVPLLVIANLFFLLLEIFLRMRIFWLTLLVLISGYLALGTFYKTGGANETVPEGALSVMTFNTRGFNLYGWIESPTIEREIIEFVRQEDPEIICFQEFSRLYEREVRGYPHRYATPYITDRTTQAIFSKYPIVNKGSLNFPESKNNALFADIVYRGDTLRVYNVHLQSYRVIPSRRMVRYMASGRFYKRFTSAFVKQQEQALLIRKHMAASPYRIILCGDFNNTQFSRAYHIIKGEMNDSYLEKGSGFGTTYRLKFLPLRIDAILADPSMTVESHRNYRQRMSDHFPVMASFSLGNTNNNNP